MTPLAFRCPFCSNTITRIRKVETFDIFPNGESVWTGNRFLFECCQSVTNYLEPSQLEIVSDNDMSMVKYEQ